MLHFSRGYGFVIRGDLKISKPPNRAAVQFKFHAICRDVRPDSSEACLVSIGNDVQFIICLGFIVKIIVPPIRRIILDVFRNSLVGIVIPDHMIVETGLPIKINFHPDRKSTRLNSSH